MSVRRWRGGKEQKTVEAFFFRGWLDWMDAINLDLGKKFLVGRGRAANLVEPIVMRLWEVLVETYHYQFIMLSIYHSSLSSHDKAEVILSLLVYPGICGLSSS